MRELRKQGLGLKEIARATGSNTSKVQRVVKDIPMAIGLYHRELPAALVKGAIINLDTTGLDADVDDIIAFGFLERYLMTVVMRIETTQAEFYDIIREKLSHLAQPIYAYDARFHEDFILAKLQIPIKLIDILETWRDKARAKAMKIPSLDELASVPRQYFGETVVTERQVRSQWANYKKYQDKRSLLPIVRHCMEDLRQALYVMTFTEELSSK